MKNEIIKARKDLREVYNRQVKETIELLYETYSKIDKRLEILQNA